MTEWIGQLLANWPIWTAILVLIIASILWFYTKIIYYTGRIPFEKKEWWQDKEKRQQLRIKKMNEKSKMKAKKG